MAPDNLHPDSANPDDEGPDGDVAESRATVVVTLSDDASDQVERVTEQLQGAGLEVEQVLDFIGQIVGKLATDDVDRLRAIEGVADVETSRTVQLPPPGSVIQ